MDWTIQNAWLFIRMAAFGRVAKPARFIGFLPPADAPRKWGALMAVLYSAWRSPQTLNGYCYAISTTAHFIATSSAAVKSCCGPEERVVISFRFPILRFLPAMEESGSAT